MGLSIHTVLVHYAAVQPLTEGPGIPWRPGCPRRPFMPLSPLSPATPFSPRGPAGPYIEQRHRHKHIVVHSFCNFICFASVLYLQGHL